MSARAIPASIHLLNEFSDSPIRQEFGENSPSPMASVGSGAQAGGPSLQTECDAYIKKHKEVNTGAVVWSNPGAISGGGGRPHAAFQSLWINTRIRKGFRIETND